MEAFWLYLHILLLVFGWALTSAYSSLPSGQKNNTQHGDPTDRAAARHGARPVTPLSPDADHTLGLSIGRDKRLAEPLGHGAGCFVVIGRHLAGNSLARVFID